MNVCKGCKYAPNENLTFQKCETTKNVCERGYWGVIIVDKKNILDKIDTTKITRVKVAPPQKARQIK